MLGRDDPGLLRDIISEGVVLDDRARQSADPAHLLGEAFEIHARTPECRRSKNVRALFAELLGHQGHDPDRILAELGIPALRDPDADVVWMVSPPGCQPEKPTCRKTKRPRYETFPFPGGA